MAFGLVDVDENPDASMEFQIKAVPTFVSFDGEAQVESFSGADTTKLEAMVKSLQARWVLNYAFSVEVNEWIMMQ